MAKHEPDPDGGGPYPGNWPDTRKRDRDIPRSLWLFLFCTIIILAAMFLTTVAYMGATGADPAALIDAVTSVDGIIPTVLGSLVLVVQFIQKRQTNRVEALAGREGPSFVMDELNALREAVARVEAAPVLTSGPIPVVVAPTPEPGLVAVTVDEEHVPYVPPAPANPYAGLPQSRQSWAERTTPSYTPEPDGAYVLDPHDEEPPAPPTRVGRREAIPAWAEADLQEAPPAPRRWTPGG